MSESNDQLTRPQLVGMLLLGVCLWAVIVGLIYVIVADDRFPGFVIAATGLIGSYILNRWLMFIGKPPKE